eukprot:s130_g22.t1
MMLRWVLLCAAVHAQEIASLLGPRACSRWRKQQSPWPLKGPRFGKSFAPKSREVLSVLNEEVLMPRRLHSVKTSWWSNLSTCSPNPKVV